jgi:hypothetical protein
MSFEAQQLLINSSLSIFVTSGFESLSKKLLDNLCQEDLLCFLLKSFIFKLYVKEYDPF